MILLPHASLGAMDTLPILLRSFFLFLFFSSSFFFSGWKNEKKEKREFDRSRQKEKRRKERRDRSILASNGREWRDIYSGAKKSSRQYRCTTNPLTVSLVLLSVDRPFCLVYGNYGADSYQEARKYQGSGIGDVYGSLRRRRSKKKNYVCPKCGNGYTVVKSLKRHLRYECGVAPRFKCPYCGTRSKQRAHVNEHIRRKHSGQRIYIIDSP